MALTSQQGAGPAAPVEVSHAPLESGGAGAAIERWTLRAGAVEVTVLSLGATLHTVRTPDRHGEVAQVLLASEALGQILGPARHFGATVGRYANRIADSRITLDGIEYRLAPTGNGVTLHGGPDGFANRMWATAPAADGDRAGVRLRLHSADGDQGFPGALDVEVDYLLAPSGELSIEYRAVTTRPTVVNLTNHAYFNLAGEGSGDVLGHLLTLDADAYTPVDERQIPYGPYEPVAGTPFDFTTATPIGKGISDGHPQLAGPGGYDHNWVLRPRSADGRPTRAALLEDPVSGRVLEVLTTEPGLQVYTANTFQGAVTGDSGVPYGPFAGVALETQHHPDSPHNPAYPSTLLRPAEEFRSVTVLRFSRRFPTGNAV
ncbi:aldose 1-epimerase [Kitasatospora sp. MAP12-15]|uniref:aldose epimerase family protein n=1 Tax=unclassified Kitasatospora TaxID=2633591 RepID=UPI002473040C|nr:aldose epimerase family protein [Kitasatospora sp. MAP12-44]MDH6109137.1 aldose 1-epimerase [Kitasatospora sp. MAP12-44]